MNRQELRLVLKALEGDKEAREELEKIADNDARWSKWPKVKMIANASLAISAALTGLGATAKVLWNYLKD